MMAPLSHRRGELTQQQWERIQPLLPAQKPKTGRPSLSNRQVVNGILWVLRTGAPWRDLPKRYGAWQTVSGRFSRWQRSGLWQQLLEELQHQAETIGQVNSEIHHVDGSIVRAHQHAAGAKRES